MVFKESLEEGLHLFHHLFEEAPLGIAVEDLDGKLLRANPSLCSILGYQEGELCGMDCSQFANPEDSQDDWALFQQLRAGLIDHYSLDKRYVRKDGAQVFGRLNVSLLKTSAAGSPLVVAVVEDVTERRHAEEAMRQSEERFRLAVQAGKMFAYEWDAATDVIVRSGESAQILGIDEAAQVTSQQILNKVHPDDRERLLAAVGALSAERPHLQVSYRMVSPDGNVIWVERTSRAHFDEQGRVLRIVGMVTDITERKRAEEALTNVSRRLIEAQEQERVRIARELHDDIGQRLAMLAVELEELHQNPPILPAIRSRMRELHRQTSEIATDLQSLSHKLHSSKLEYLGIAAAMTGFCKQFSEQQDVGIDFRSRDLPGSLPPDASLCLFRVMQEALHNSAKHSGAQQIEVRLWGTPDEIHLTVRDSGAGFDSESAKESRGLGLISMGERLNLVKGTLSIESHPKRGTTIHARLPLSSGSDSICAVG